MNKNYFTSIIPINTLKTCYFLLVTCFSISISTYSQTTKTLTSSSVNPLEIPAGVTSLSVKCWGAGGGGGGANILNGAGGGGGGGAYRQGNVTVGADKDNVKVPYIVGIGGIGGNFSSTNGQNGGASTFGTVSANGGAGGGGTSLSITLGIFGKGGDGGAGGFFGGDGATANNLLVGLSSGGGGGGAGSGAKGGNAGYTLVIPYSGSGGVSDTNGSGAGGAGGNGSLLAGSGYNGVVPGGGGGGGVILLSLLGGVVGGNGGNGQIKVTYTCPTYNVTSVSSTSACNTFGTATITLGSSAAGLPIGTYTVTYDRTVPSASGLTAIMVVETAGRGTFTATGLTTAGTSRITIKKIKSVDCETDISASNKYADLTVNTVPVQPGTISGYSYQCAGNISQTYSIASVPNTASYIWTVDTASGWAITSGENSNSITVTVGSSSANISVVAVNECGNSTASTLTVSLNIPAPTASVTLQPTCAVPTGTITITAPVPSAGISYSIDGVDYSNTTGIFTSVPIGDYTITAKYPSTCISSVTNLAMASSVVVRTWNGAWDGIPTIENKVIFAENYNDDPDNLDESVDITACSCEVNSGAHVTIKSGRFLKLRNELIVDQAGSLTFENNASLVQLNDAVENLGEIIYKRHTKPVKRYDFTYWSSPVEGTFLRDVSPFTLGDKYYSFNPILGWQIHYNGNQKMHPGEGYIIRAPQSFSITEPTVDESPEFKGVPNNGEVKKDLTGGLVYLMGNPYPSAISADAFLNENAVQLEGTLYFWTHNSPPSSNVDGDAIYNYTANDYATYNLTGGVATHPAVQDDDENDPNDNNNLNVPSGNIAAAQGFFASASAAGGEIVFNNSMRLLDGEVMDDGEAYDEVRDNSQFFKLRTTSKASNDIEKNRVWLNLSNAEGAFKQILVGYISGATNDYEGKFDGISYDGNQYLDFYSINQTLNLAIQGRGLPFQSKDSVALGYKSTIAGDFKISIDYADGILASQKVFLEDKVLQVLHDLKVPYSFTTEKGIFNDRFVLRYEDKNALTEDVKEMAVEGVVISNQNKTITIATSDEIINAVYIYDFSGGLVYLDSKVNLETTTISNISGTHQVLIVKVVLENGKKAVKKIIY